MGVSEYREVIRQLAPSTKALRAASPDVWAGFAALNQAAVADGAVPARIKELVAVAIAVVKECDGCIAYHARGAARQGATEEELAEILGVALLMDGGPATVYGPRAWDAFHEFAAAVPAADG